ncbi:DUF4073 domain-containing protein [Paenibacillus sp. 2003]|uniref:DUF4073 domain-containing protein n=1 Tax=Paenibacillus TaxID=44249 RepID=UPI00285C53E8|nr:DUF4073 domain-containing protein [Paenibacillus sp. 2003]MDR6719284.1 hypothetical protein [Paenibacillus sp. 2003]
MQYRKIVKILLILLLVAPWLAPVGKVSAEVSYPVPGKDGLITVKNIGDDSVELSWEYAESVTTPSPDLNYQVFVSQAPNIKDMEEISGFPQYAYGNWVGGSDSETGTFTKVITDLVEGETYYFNVIVQDRNNMEIAYQMQSITVTSNTLLSEFNNVIGPNFDASRISELLQNTSFITMVPAFESLPPDEQNAIISLVGHSHLPDGKYLNTDQIQFTVDLAFQGLLVMREHQLPVVQAKLTSYFEKLANANNVFSPEYLSVIQPQLYQYLLGPDLDKNILSYSVNLDRIGNDLSLEQSVMNLNMMLSQSFYFTKASTTNEMNEALTGLYKIQQKAEQYKGTPKESLIGIFPLDFHKMQIISSNVVEMERLSKWMLDRKPNGGYTNYSEIQIAFNNFFFPMIPPLPTFPPFPPIQPIPVAPAVSVDDSANVIVDADETMEYTQNNGENWFDYSSTNPPQFEGNTTVWVRVKANGSNTASLYKILIFTLEPLKVINEARATKNTDAILGAITQPEWLDLPAGFDNLQPEEKKAVANVVMTFLPSDYAYDLKKQVQYAVEIGYKGIQTIKQTDKMLFQQHLNEFYSLFVESTEYFEYPGMEMIKELGQKYLNASNVDKELLAYTAKRLFQGSDLSIEQIYGASLMLVMNYSYINDARGVSEMQNAMLMLYSFQQSTEVMEPYEPFLLKLNAMKDLVEDENRMGKLAQWMLDRKPSNGYSSISEVQIAFDRFFDQVIIINPTPTPTPTPSTGGESGGSSPVTSAPAPTTKQEQIVVDVNGTNGTNLTKTPITRTTETNGTIKDLVKMTEAIAKESVEKAKQLNMNTARIVIPDTKDSVSETRIELPKAAVKELNDGSLKLEISTENVVISVPTNSIAGFDQDLYFRVVPLKKESERKEVEERAKKEQLIQQVAPNTNVRVLARPVEIDTNMQSREVTLTLPLRDSLPTDPAARQQALDNLAIYIEHSDGTKELIQGKLVKLADNSEGIEFPVTKFSTFTLVVVDGLKASQSTHQPYIQGFGADFRPDAFVTRAQMAAMLARNLPTEAAAGSANNVSYKDVSATHWATSEIQKAQSAGIMNGMSNTQFAPEGSITRAQMATIAYRWMQQQASATTVNGTAVSFTDVSADLWAADAIAYVQSAGLMVGYNDGTFKPDSQLTRAEAVKVLNVLFNRTPLTGAATPTFSDVPTTHWAYADIEAAAQK